ncbi:MAG: DNA-directed RNA polymerase subunit alpha [Flavobacteriaceae bacterium]|nr:DNA-directed RNA polymerase subunit alpha [Flavobacteriaceae bacterium]MCY4216351.1 DNA-directed RNA polymerase subunit alpha [Flavobacteriaceae bacterium]MCY4253281.1 DNA-directed RNA polymerase subunit alpha [Flavobacteriaceae bacterium]
MSALNFQRPDKVIVIGSTENHGSFEFRPLEPGYGLTVGNALRRVLLSSLEGFAVTSVKFSGIVHEFDTIDGIVEDITEIILNIKQIRFKQLNEHVDHEEISFRISNPGEFKAGDLKDYTSSFDILNPDFVLFNVSKQIDRFITLTVEKGIGYVLADDNKKEDAQIGELAVDSVFTPITNVKYRVEDYRVEQKTDYEKLIIDIDTDGSIAPKDALIEAANVLITHFRLITDDEIQAKVSKPNDNVLVYDEEFLEIKQLLQTRLQDLNLSVRALNCLVSASVNTLGDLVSYQKSDLMKFRNFGKKSLTELEEIVIAKKLKFGMDISKYHLKSSKDQDLF